MTHTRSSQTCKEQLQDPVFRGWLQLNYTPSRWVHPTWIESKADRVPEQLLHGTLAQPWLRKQLGLEYLQWEFFQTPCTRLLLAPCAALNHVMAAIGAMCYQINTKRLIEKRLKQQIDQYLPPATVAYIEKTGPLLLAQRPLILEQMAQCIPLWNPQQQQLCDLTAVGEHVFHKALADAIEQTQESDLARWRHYYQLKFPLNKTAQVIPSGIDAPATNQIITLIVKLIRHLEPQCLPLLK